MIMEIATEIILIDILMINPPLLFARDHIRARSRKLNGLLFGHGSTEAEETDTFPARCGSNSRKDRQNENLINSVYKPGQGMCRGNRKYKT
jgi:hypothetical protein